MSTETEIQLRDSIEDLYRVFAPYAQLGDPEGCPCPVCATDKNKAKLRAAPLRELSKDHLWHFTHCALLTWGTSEDFRHFLPRIFELVATGGRFGLLDPETAFQKLKLGESNQWPTHEQESVQRFLEAFWRDTLQNNLPDYQRIEVSSCLCAICRGVDDVRPFLEIWEKEMSPIATNRFVEFVWENLVGTKIEGIWWETCPQQADQIAQWVLSPDRTKALEAAFLEFCENDETAAYTVDSVIAQLQAARTLNQS